MQSVAIGSKNPRIRLYSLNPSSGLQGKEIILKRF